MKCQNLLDFNAHGGHKNIQYNILCQDVTTVHQQVRNIIRKFWSMSERVHCSHHHFRAAPSRSERVHGSYHHFHAAPARSERVHRSYHHFRAAPSMSKRVHWSYHHFHAAPARSERVHGSFHRLCSETMANAFCLVRRKFRHIILQIWWYNLPRRKISTELYHGWAGFLNQQFEINVSFRIKT